jgi:hypothetical protein
VSRRVDATIGGELERRIGEILADSAEADSAREDASFVLRSMSRELLDGSVEILLAVASEGGAVGYSALRGTCIRTLRECKIAERQILAAVTSGAEMAARLMLLTALQRDFLLDSDLCDAVLVATRRRSAYFGLLAASAMNMSSCHLDSARSIVEAAIESGSVEVRLASTDTLYSWRGDRDWRWTQVLQLQRDPDARVRDAARMPQSVRSGR